MRNGITKKLFMVLAFVLLVFTAFQVRTSAFTEGVQAKYKTDFATYEESLAAAAEFNIEIAGESFVLLKNENQALPLGKTESYISMFGARSNNIVLGGAGSGSGSSAGAKSIEDGLVAAGFRLNPALLNIYKSANSNVELPVSAIEGETASFGMYDNAAIIVFTRTGSEFNEAALYAVSGHTDPLDHYYSLDDNEKDLVDFVADRFEKVVVVINSAHPMELAYIEDHEGVDSILWIGHPGANGAMAVGPVLRGEINPSGKTSDIYPANFKKDPTWPNFKGNVQAHLVVGDDGKLYTHYVSEGHEDNVLAPLNNGTDGIARNDWDYYQYSRVMDKDGKTVTVDGPSQGARYYATLDYEEGIYMGYRWYETAAEAGFFDVDSNGVTLAERQAATPAKYGGDLYYNRRDGVVYPFGYGLSYTSFDVTIDSVKHNGATFATGGTLNTADGQEITVNVKVTNTGNLPGKKVVQLYYSAPYITGEIEKSSVTFLDFEKSKLLSPGQSQIIPITFFVQDMASFDFDDANNNGHAGYELDAGEYKIGIYDSSHELLDSIDAVISETRNYDKDQHTGGDVKVRFTGDGTWDGTRSDLTYYDSRRTEFVSETPMTYLSRADFDGTFPQAPTESDLRWTDDAILIMQAQVYYSSFNDLPTDPWYKTAADVAGWTQAVADAEGVVEGRVDGKTAISLYDMSGVAFDDPEWDEFLNQLTFDELRSLISSNMFRTPGLDAIGKPASSDQDGPAQFAAGTFWVSEVNIASTFNKEIAYKQGLFIGNESLFQGVSGWYAPGLNIHRNPTAGRNFEYYSQDGIHNGIIAAHVIKGATDKGVVTYMKHLLLNDQETSRYTASTFVTEQALREIYAKPWEYAIKFGKANASMSAFNKIGLLSTTAHYNLYEGLLREEWGFRHSTVTDMFGWGYSPGSSGDMAARTNITPLGSWNNTFGRNIEGEWDAEKNNVVVTFIENVTDGTRWTKDDATGTATARINAQNPISINKINSRDFADYDVTGIMVDYATSTANGPSAAYKDATTMKDGTELYVDGDTRESYTQWYAVRTTAKSLLFAQANSNTMQNGVDKSFLEALEPKTINGDQGANLNGNVSYEGLEDVIYSITPGKSLPAGLELSSNGRLTGSSLMAGEFDLFVDITIAGFINTTIKHKLVLTPTFVPSGLDSVLINTPVVDAKLASSTWRVGYRLGWWEQVTDLTYNLIDGQLPTGLSIDSAGNITGTPTQIGLFEAVVGTTVVTSQGRVFDFISPLAIEVADISPELKATVTFDGNFEGSSPVLVDVLKGQQVAPAAEPSRNGYTFMGWFADAEATTAFDFAGAIEADTTIYASWKSLEADSEALAEAKAALEASIAALTTRIDALAAQGDPSSDITEIKAALLELEGLLESSDGDMTEVQASIQAMNAKITALEQVETPTTPEAKPNNGLAVAALIIGIVAIVAVAGVGFVAFRRK